MSLITYRPLEAWTDPVTKHRQPHQFKTTFDESLMMLRTEVDYLAPAGPLGRPIAVEVVVQVDTAERDVRRDGMLRADARVRTPGVVVSFDSRYGPLRYATDQFTDASWTRRMPGWQANVRAIALSLEALRKVDRYGVTRRGEQYTGWAALGSGRPMGPAAPKTAAEAAAYLIGLIGHEYPTMTTTDLLRRVEAVKMITRSAMRRHHPDHGGDAETFKLVNAARDVLNQHHHERSH